MRFSFVILLFAISMVYAIDDAGPSNDSGIKRYLDLELGTSCPGNMLHLNATSSDGVKPAGIELRIVLYEPYYGLRGLTHTDANGSASIELSKIGNYRIYFSTVKYNHAEYVEFDYPSLCPPPPPKEMNLTMAADCARGIVMMNATSDGNPLDGVFIRSDSWSTMTNTGGSAFLPYTQDETDYIFIRAEKAGFVSQSGWFGIPCGGFRP